jgi:hypothetical protein
VRWGERWRVRGDILRCKLRGDFGRRIRGRSVRLERESKMDAGGRDAFTFVARPVWEARGGRGRLGGWVLDWGLESACSV